ncbi:MAG: M14 family zinc carboxypeptidase [Planctomycetota bacterium]|nr:M14 family zinc carboxypeptidase [Planctomycetota bacterium]
MHLPGVGFFLGLVATVSVVFAQTPIVSASGETMRLRSSTVSATGSNSFDITLVVEDDNNNSSLPTSYRRWWHCEIRNLNPGGNTLTITVDSRSGYSDVILPVWSTSANGLTFGPYQRCPTSAVPQVLSGGRHRFTLTTPVGVRAFRLAKYFPYTVTRKDLWIASVANDPRVSVDVLGSSVQGRPIQRLRVTDNSVPSAGKVGVWIHSGIHPAETTSYLVVEGLVDWLLSADPFAASLLDDAIIHIVPMANPDGVVAGNYRTNVNSSNLESQWAAPYNSPQPEVAALRTEIEQLMGTVGSPAANPLQVVLNLHSSHNVSFPFHFRHNANSNWSPGATGVIPLVNQIETQWINAFRQSSPFVNRGPTLSSSAGFPSRPYVESMMHDRWTAVNGWLNAPGNQQPVMAITFEGTYGRGPDGVTWNTEADYRLCGLEMGQALADYLGVGLSASTSLFGSPCTTANLSASLLAQPDGSHQTTLTLVGAPGNALGWLMLGFQQVQLPLPAPWAACDQLVSIDGVSGLVVNSFGIGQISFGLPPWPGLEARFQTLTADIALAPNVMLDTSNGVTVRNDY